MDRAYEKADKIKGEMVPFLSEANHLQDQIDALTQFVRVKSEELKSQESLFRNQISLIEQQNRERVKSYWSQRVTELNNRWKYYSALKSMAGFMKNE